MEFKVDPALGKASYRDLKDEIKTLFLSLDHAVQ